MLIGSLLAFAYFILALLFQAHGIYGGDAGDIVTAAVTGGVAHPPGYPLMMILGRLFSLLPWFTPAWRVTLISSLSHAVTLLIVYQLVTSVTRNRLAALVSVIALSGNYVFFLYSVTPEVFGLFDLFFVLLLYLSYRLLVTNQMRIFWMLIFVFGLSLSHQHIILFLLPALFYLIYLKGTLLRKSMGEGPAYIIFMCFLLSLGLTPYLYVPFAARGGSIINWNYVTSFSRFFSLVTRADYGTFVSGGFYGAALIQRLIDVKAYVQILSFDMGIGIFFSALGFYWLWQHRRRFGVYLGIALVSFGPAFFFYASFPLVNRFTIGTYERFMLPSFVLLSLMVGIGAHATLQLVVRVFASVGRLPITTVGMFMLLFFLLRAFGSIQLFWGLANDYTADNYGKDILESVPAHGLLLLGKDTPLFITQYVRYALNYRADVMAIHAGRLTTIPYQDLISSVYPKLWVPKGSTGEEIAQFVTRNASMPIYANTRFPVGSEWLWVPHGLVYKLVQTKNLPSIAETIAQNDALWEGYHDLTNGILSRYNHLMLADVRDGYGQQRLEYGKMLLKANDLSRARRQFLEVIRLAGDASLPDGYTYLGLTELFDNNCQEALDAFDHARNLNLSEDKELYLYEAATYRDCMKDSTKASVAKERYDQLRKALETQLEAR